jgi:hypothetical protein
MNFSYFNISANLADILELMKLLFSVILGSHLFACLWYGVARASMPNRTWLD